MQENQEIDLMSYDLDDFDYEACYPKDCADKRNSWTIVPSSAPLDPSECEKDSSNPNPKDSGHGSDADDDNKKSTDDVNSTDSDDDDASDSDDDV